MQETIANLRKRLADIDSAPLFLKQNAARELAGDLVAAFGVLAGKVEAMEKKANG